MYAHNLDRMVGQLTTSHRVNVTKTHRIRSRAKRLSPPSTSLRGGCAGSGPNPAEPVSTNLTTTWWHDRPAAVHGTARSGRPGGRTVDSCARRAAAPPGQVSFGGARALQLDIPRRRSGR